MNEINIAGKTYISTKRAAEITGYSKDYVGQLCREGYVAATMVGRSWYVLEDSVREHRFGKDVNTATSEGQKAEEVEVIEDTQNWKPATYTHEEVVELPATAHQKPMQVHVAIDVSDSIERPKEVLVHNSTSTEDTVTSMQNAWKEWFAAQSKSTPVEKDRLDRVGEAQVDLYEETADETEEIIDATSYIPAEIATQPEFIRKEQEITQLTRHYTHVQEHDVAGGGKSLVLKVGIIAIGVLSLVVAIIGSGLADSYINTSLVGSLPFIGMLQGRTEVIR